MAPSVCYFDSGANFNLGGRVTVGGDCGMGGAKTMLSAAKAVWVSKILWLLQPCGFESLITHQYFRKFLLVWFGQHRLIYSLAIGYNVSHIMATHITPMSAL